MSRETRSMLIACTVAVVVGWLTASSGLCGERDGNALLDSCTDALRLADKGYRSTNVKELTNHSWCIGYVLGWVEGYREGVIPALAPLCIPPDQITALQLVRVLVKYLRDHPQLLHLDRSDLILSVLREAFPCKAP